MLQIESVEDVQRIVSERIEESAGLEFKRQLPESGKNDDLAKDMAAMANSGGGVILYGVTESSGVATGLAPFAVAGAVERITMVASTIDEPPSLESVRRLGDPNCGYIVVTVAPTTRGPHLVRGLALGRTAGGNTFLTRRQVGELFARSEGFAAEFGLAMGHPGRAAAFAHREEHQRVSFDKVVVEPAHYLVLNNDGDSPVTNVGWRWSADLKGRVVAPSDPQPLPVLHPRTSVRVRVMPTLGASFSGAITTWTDAAGSQHEEFWPLSFT